MRSLLWTLSSLALLAAGTACSAEFPSRPVRVVVPLAAGGQHDMLARSVGQRMRESLGVAVVVDNRPGASGAIAAEIVAKSAPDGYTMLIVGPAQVAINPSLYPKLPYDARKDFAAVGLGVSSAMLLVAHPSFPPNTVRELVAMARSRPGAYSYASVGTASPQHLAGEWFKMITSTNIVHVPYKGGAPATAALLGGQETQTGFVGMGPALPQVKAGRLKPLGITTLRRSPALPGLPTLAEQGVTDFDMSTWSAFVVPAKTPRSVIATLNADIVRILTLEDVRESFLRAGVEATPSSPAELARLIKSEEAKYREIIQAANVKAD